MASHDISRHLTTWGRGNSSRHSGTLWSDRCHQRAEVASTPSSNDFLNGLWAVSKWDSTWFKHIQPIKHMGRLRTLMEYDGNIMGIWNIGNIVGIWWDSILDCLMIVIRWYMARETSSTGNFSLFFAIDANHRNTFFAGYPRLANQSCHEHPSSMYLFFCGPEISLGLTDSQTSYRPRSRDTPSTLLLTPVSISPSIWTHLNTTMMVGYVRRRESSLPNQVLVCFFDRKWLITVVEPSHVTGART